MSHIVPFLEACPPPGILREARWLAPGSPPVPWMTLEATFHFRREEGALQRSQVAFLTILFFNDL